MYGHERSLVESMNGRPFVLLGVNSDKKKETALEAIKKNDLNWRSFWDGSTRGPISKSFEIRGWPTIFLVDHEGVIQAKNLRGEKLDIALAQLVSRAEADGATGEPDAGKWRTFTDITGKYSIEAMFIKFEDGIVTLKRKDDEQEIELEYEKLSKDDRTYAREERRRQRIRSRSSL